MVQHVLEVKIGKEKVISKPWNFEAMCIYDDTKRMGKTGELRAAAAAVAYLFEGTDATLEELKKLSVSKMSELCIKVTKWYLKDLDDALKNA